MLGDLEAIASPSPPPAAAPAVCGLPSASKPRLAVGTAAAMSVDRSLGPSVPSVPATSSLGFLALGDLEVTAPQPPPPATAPAVCGLSSASQSRLGVGTAAAESADRSHGSPRCYDPAYVLEYEGWSLLNHGTRRIMDALTPAARKGILLLPTKTHLGLRRDYTRNHASRLIANPTRLRRRSLLGCRRRRLHTRPARSRWWPR